MNINDSVDKPKSFNLNWVVLRKTISEISNIMFWKANIFKLERQEVGGH